MIERQVLELIKADKNGDMLVDAASGLITGLSALDISTLTDYLDRSDERGDFDFLKPLKTKDPSFSYIKFIAYARECLTQICTLTPTRLSDIDYFIDPAWYKNNAGGFQMARFGILESDVVGFKTDADYDYLRVQFKISYFARDWQKRDMVLVFKRKSSVRTGKIQSLKSCSSCGAPLEGYTGDVCEYCESTLNSGEIEWVVCG